MKFLYEAKTQGGERQVGEIEATNRDIALDILRSNNLIILSLTAAKDAPVLSRNIALLERISLKEVAIVTRQLSVMVESKVPLVQSIQSLASQTDKQKFKSKLSEVAHDVEGGMLFSDALAKHPKVFSGLYVSIIKSGEVSGRLGSSLLYLADHLEREHDLRGKVKGAMVYPIFILVSFIAVGFVMMIVVFPKITSLLAENGQDLPAITSFLIGISNFLRSFWWLLVVFLIGLFFLFRFWVSTKKGRYQLDAFKVRVPIFGPLLKKIYLARFNENLATLVSGGIPIIKALDISGQVVGNLVYRRVISNAIVDVRAGQGIGLSLAKSKYIPKMVSDMISVGEQSGQLETVLKNTSRFYRREVDTAVGSITTLIEPIIIVAMGIMVAFLVAGVLIPIYQVSTGGL
jgi:type IV pilus assembly protein PilC